jgi:hypothetical protein
VLTRGLSPGTIKSGDRSVVIGDSLEGHDPAKEPVIPDGMTLRISGHPLCWVAAWSCKNERPGAGMNLQTGSDRPDRSQACEGGRSCTSTNSAVPIAAKDLPRKLRTADNVSAALKAHAGR